MPGEYMPGTYPLARSRGARDVHPATRTSSAEHRDDKASVRGYSVGVARSDLYRVGRAGRELGLDEPVRGRAAARADRGEPRALRDVAVELNSIDPCLGVARAQGTAPARDRAV